MVKLFKFYPADRYAPNFIFINCQSSGNSVVSLL